MTWLPWLLLLALVAAAGWAFALFTFGFFRGFLVVPLELLIELLVVFDFWQVRDFFRGGRRARRLIIIVIFTRDLMAQRNEL